MSPTPSHDNHIHWPQDGALSERLVAGTALVRRAIRKQIVDGHADDGEEEDDQTPDELLDWRTGRLQDLD